VIWPSEDGGPKRLAATDLRLSATLRATTRATRMSTMTVLGDPGEVFLLTHDALRSNFGLPTFAQVERIDPVTLKPLARSPRLKGGPMWPGGLAVLAPGDLVSVYGRWVHRLDRDCEVRAALELPIAAPWNSFVSLGGGLIVTKNLSDTAPAQLTVIDTNAMRIVAQAQSPEPSIARLSAIGDMVYLVGTRSIMRWRWTGTALVRDDGWTWDYLARTTNTYGWDVVLDGADAWFMDNGRHRYRTSMIGRGVAQTPNHLLRISLTDAADHEAVEVSGLPGGSITNPPLVDPARGIVVAYDSANRVVQAFDWQDRRLTRRWHRDDVGAASHMLLTGDGGIVTNDYGRGGEHVIVLDILTGATRSRVKIGGWTQGVVFPSPGWDNDLYFCSMSRVARVF
jgi:hypothetical protein